MHDDIGYHLRNAADPNVPLSERQNSFCRVMAHYSDMAFAAAYAATCDADSAEDIAQESFIIAWQRLPSLREPSAFPTWLRRIVRTQCHRTLRGRKPPTVPLEPHHENSAAVLGPDHQVEQQETVRTLHDLIRQLPTGERSVVVLFCVNQYSQEEIGRFLGVPVTTVKKRLHTARQRLRENTLTMLQDDLSQQRPSANSTFQQRVMEAIREFSALIDSGTSIVAALHTLAQSQDDAHLKQVLQQVQSDITGDGKIGKTLSEAMEGHPQVFRAHDIARIKSAELNGNLALVLRQLARAT